MEYTVSFSEHDTEVKRIFGEQYIQVNCVATLTDFNGHSEQYHIHYYRSPITGELRSVICDAKPEEETTEYTLTIDSVQDLCSDELSYN